MSSQREVRNSLYLQEHANGGHMSVVVPGIIRVNKMIDFKTIHDERVGPFDLLQHRRENTYLVIFHPNCVNVTFLNAIKFLMYEILGDHPQGATLVIDPECNGYDSSEPLEVIYRTEYSIGTDDFLMFATGHKIDYSS